MEGEVRVRFGVPSGDGDEDDSGRADVRAGADEHVNHRLHDDLLPIHAGCRVLAVVESELQCARQLHESLGVFSDQQ